MKPALVIGGCHTRTRHSVKPLKCDSSCSSLALVTSIGWELQRTGSGTVWG